MRRLRRLNDKKRVESRVAGGVWDRARDLTIGRVDVRVTDHVYVRVDARVDKRAWLQPIQVNDQ